MRVPMFRLIALAAACCFITPPARGDDAPTTRPAFTEHDVIALLLDFNDKFVVDAYRTGGHRDARWDADVLALLPLEIRASTVSPEAYYALSDVARLATRVTLARRIVAAGCDDAMALWMAGRSIEADGDVAAAGAIYARADEAAARSNYVPIFQLGISRASWDANKLDRSSTAGQKLAARMDDLIRASLTDKRTLPANRRAVWNSGTFVFIDDSERNMIQLGEAIAPVAADADPWIFHVLMGRVEIKRAWRARGSGYADTVTEDGWKQFHAHVAEARRHFELAVAADDAHPQPFAYMLVVAMAEQSGNEDAWFAHAIARQLDYKAAYDNYFSSQMPRWGGTHVKMLGIGQAALATGRFDTRVPAQLLTAIQWIEVDGELDERQRRRVYPDVVRCLDGYIEHTDSAVVRRWARSLRAAWAVRLGRWDEAQAQFAALDAAGEQPVESAFTQFKLDLAPSRARAAAGR